MVFRDASGRIVGGVAGRDRPATDADSNARVTVQPGISVRHFHLKPDEIPAGADLERTEIGPGGILAGGEPRNDRFVSGTASQLGKMPPF
ncbi:hypothetical protein GCM10029992_24420 [Glycomyces albus]